MGAASLARVEAFYLGEARLIFVSPTTLAGIGRRFAAPNEAPREGRRPQKINKRPALVHSTVSTKDGPESASVLGNGRPIATFTQERRTKGTPPTEQETHHE